MRETFLRACDVLQLGPQATLQEALMARNRLLSTWMPLTRSPESWQQRRATQRVHEVETAYQHLYEAVARGQLADRGQPVFNGATSVGLQRISIFEQRLLHDGAPVLPTFDQAFNGSDEAGMTSVIPLSLAPPARPLPASGLVRSRAPSSAPDSPAEKPRKIRILPVKPISSQAWLAGSSLALASLGWALAALGGLSLGVLLTLVLGRGVLATPVAVETSELAGDAAIPTPLAAAEIEGQLRDAQGEVAGCLVHASSASGGAQRIEVDLTVALSGALQAVTLGGDAAAIADSGPCIEAILRRRLRFHAQPQAGLQIRIPMQLLPAVVEDAGR